MVEPAFSRAFAPVRIVLNDVMASSQVLPRRLRAVGRGIALAAAVTLIAATAFAFFANRMASGIVINGHGEHLMHELRRAHPPDRPYDAGQLAPVIERFAPEGLRCVTVFGADLQILVRVGRCEMSDDEARAALRDFRPGLARPAGAHFFAIHRIPGAGPFDREAGGPPPPADGPHRWPFLIEFDAPPAHTLAVSGYAVLLAGLLAAAALLAATWLNQRLTAQSEQLEAALGRERHLATLGEMSAVLAHEIRNPLASLKGHAQLLAEHAVDEPWTAERAGILVREILRLETLCEQLLEFVRASRVEPIAADPAGVLRDAVGAVDQARIEVHADAAPATWRLDPWRMQQALVNLLENALHASTPDHPPCATARSEGSALVFEVRDHGPGVPDAERARIFEPFHTTRVRGTGLGLAITRRIVELHGGTVDVRNHPDGGAIFRIELPGG